MNRYPFDGSTFDGGLRYLVITVSGTVTESLTAYNVSANTGLIGAASVSFSVAAGIIAEANLDTGSVCNVSFTVAGDPVRYRVTYAGTKPLSPQLFPPPGPIPPILIPDMYVAIGFGVTGDPLVNTVYLSGASGVTITDTGLLNSVIFFTESASSPAALNTTVGGAMIAIEYFGGAVPVTFAVTGDLYENINAVDADIHTFRRPFTNKLFRRIS